MYKSLISTLFFPFLLQAAVVNVPVVNVYVKPLERSELNTQAIYGSSVEILEQNGGWCKIKMNDEEIGYVEKQNLLEHSDFEKSPLLRPVKNLFAHVYQVTDTTPYPPLLTLPFGALVKVLDPVDKGERWVAIELANGEKGWIQRGDIDFSPRKKSLEEILSFGKTFLGLPYTWGGTSSYGFDCSGFTQMLFKQMGVSLPRNSRNQSESDLLQPIEKQDMRPGDLVFFGESKITHVGLYLGNNEFLQAGVRDEAPLVRISNLQTTKYNFKCARRLKNLP